MLESLITGIQTIAPTLLSVGLSLLLTLLSGILQAVPSILAGWGDYHQSLYIRNHNVAAGDLIRRDTADSVCS